MPPGDGGLATTERLLVLLGAALLAGALTFTGSTHLRSDQEAYNLLVVKKLEPGRSFSAAWRSRMGGFCPGERGEPGPSRYSWWLRSPRL